MPITELLRSLGALIFTLGLLFAIAWALKKYGLINGVNMGEKSNKRLRIIEQLWLDGGKTRLAIVSIDNIEEVFVIGPNGANHVAKAKTPRIKKDANATPII